MTCLGWSSRARKGSPTVSRTSSAKRSGQIVCWPASQPSRESPAIWAGVALAVLPNAAPMSVSMNPGSTTVTVAPLSRSSSRRSRASIRQAALLALETGALRDRATALTDRMKMTPDPGRRRAGAKARARPSGPKKFTSMTSRSAASVTSLSRGRWQVTPALQTSRSTLGCSAATAATWAWSVTSSRAATTRPGGARPLSDAGSRAAATTVAACRLSAALTKAAPTPRLAPVTSTLRPVRSIARPFRSSEPGYPGFGVLDRVGGRRLVGEPGGQGQAFGGPVEVLVGGQGAPAVGRYRGGDLGGHGVQVGTRAGQGGQSPVRGLPAGEGGRGVGQVARPRRAGQPGQPLAHAPGRPQAPLGVRVTEHRFLGGDHDVAGERELEGAGEAVAVDLRDDDRADAADQVDDPPGGQVEQVAHGPAVERAVAERLQVDPGAERPARAGQHHHHGLGLTVGPLQGGCELGEHPRGDGIERLRPVERDRGHRRVQVDADGLQAGWRRRHGRPPAWSSPALSSRA